MASGMTDTGAICPTDQLRHFTPSLLCWARVLDDPTVRNGEGGGLEATHLEHEAARDGLVEGRCLDLALLLAAVTPALAAAFVTLVLLLRALALLLEGIVVVRVGLVPSGARGPCRVPWRPRRGRTRPQPASSAKVKTADSSFARNNKHAHSKT
jgi:hypothetical protein